MKYQIVLMNRFTAGCALALVWLLSALACESFASEAKAVASDIGAQVDSPSEIFIEPVPPRELEREAGELLNLSPDVIEQSPVLQRWMNEIPDIQREIRHDPSFVTRLYAGYSFFPSSDSTSGLAVGLEDLFLADSAFTLSADYQQNFERDSTNRRRSYGADLHYYLMPLGDYFNVSPIVGYRYAESGSDYQVSGANVGVRLRLVPSRTGAADATLDQSWIVGDSEGLSITHINVGYAVAEDLRLSTDLEWQRTADEGDARVGINLEWLL